MASKILMEPSQRTAGSLAVKLILSGRSLGQTGRFSVSLIRKQSVLGSRTSVAFRKTVCLDGKCLSLILLRSSLSVRVLPGPEGCQGVS
jgi:hypothetical protein